jgi:hypothetical protein
MGLSAWQQLSEEGPNAISLHQSAPTDLLARQFPLVDQIVDRPLGDAKNVGSLLD